jgi:GH25 family lysozyme M1 (1,4-beta-N-acetylmuramidase)
MRIGVPLIKRSHPALLRGAAAAALVLMVTLSGASVATAGVIGPDVSSYNHDNGATLDWGIMHHAGGAAFAFIKATEGGGYTNPAFRADLVAARRERLIRGVYHYARPGGGTNAQIATNATAVAMQFVSTTGSLAGPGDLPPVLDLEDAGSLNPAQLQLWTHTWLASTTSLTGRTPIVYTNPSFWKDRMANAADFTSYPLWLASYGVPSPGLVGGWKSYAFWQYTDAGRMAGSSLNVDLSVFNGSLAQLRAMTVSPAQAAADAAAAQATTNAVAAQTAAAAAAGVTAAAISSTLRFTTLDGAKPADTTRGEATASRSDLRSWLSVFGLDGSRAIVGN